MPNYPGSHGRAARCAVCDGKFGLIGYYSRCTPRRSRKGVERFRARRASDRNSLLLVWQQIASEQTSENKGAAP